MKRNFALALAIITTIGLLSTISGTMIDNPDTPLLSAFGTLRYFTIQSNILIAIFFWLYYVTKGQHRFLKSIVLGAISTYITITFLGYAVFLEGIYDPEGIALLGTVINHYVTPLLVILFVVLYRKDYRYEFSQLKYWMIYLFAYLIFLLGFGLITGDYFYPFLDLNELGFLWFFVSVTGLIIVFLILSCSLIFMSKSSKVTRTQK